MSIFDLRNDLSFNPNYLRQKEAALDQILKGYQVKETWNEDLWIRGSAAAVKYNLGVDYTLSNLRLNLISPQ